MLDFLNLKPEAFGLDISDASLKIVKLKKRGRFFDLSSFGEEKIRPGIVKCGEIKDEKTLAKIIKESLKKVKGEKLKTNYVVADLPEEKAFLQVIQLPKMPLEDLKSAIIYEAENYIPLSIEKVYLDFQPIAPIVDHLDHHDVLIAALPREVVDPYISTLKLAGLEIKALEIESLALARSLIKDETANSPVLLMDLGSTRTGFTIFSGHTVRFTCSIPVSSQSFTEIISRTLNISINEAERLKIKHGLGEKIEIKIRDDKTEKRSEKGKIFEALIPALVDLSQQIKKYINYYEEHSSHEHLLSGRGKVEKVILSGGGVKLKGLSDFLAMQLNMPVEIGNPWLNILSPAYQPKKETLIYEKEESLKYTTALGLALRGIKENK